jgi:hypothetical protein
MEPRLAPLKNFNSSNNTRKCSKCNKWLDLSEFSTRIRIPSPSTKDENKKIPTLYYRSDCKTCSLKAINNNKYGSPEKRKELHRKDPRKIMLMNARQRAKQKGLDFNIELSDIVITEMCPLLNIPMYVSDIKIGPNSYSLDRIDSTKGYIKGNIMVISHKANTAKGNLSLNELELLVNNLKEVLNKPGELLELHQNNMDNQQPS